MSQVSDLILKGETGSEESQSDCDYDIKHVTGPAKSDEEHSDKSIYLEYTKVDNDSETQISEFYNENRNELLFIPEDLDPEILKSLAKSLDKNSRFLQCEVCNLTLLSKEQVSDHCSYHNPEDIVICDLCNNIISTHFYNMHLKIHKESFNQRMERKNCKTKCSICGKLLRKHYMKRHIQTHETDLSVGRKQCPICSKPITESYLAYHMKHVHYKDCKKQTTNDDSTTKLECPICSRMISKTNYKKHLSSHSSTRKKYICQVCGKEISSASSFTTHKLTHKEEYKYKCQFCPYRGKHLGLLKVHVRTHTKIYPYKCETCNASFINKSNLTAHLKTHSGVKLVCAVCGKCFASERNLRKHNFCVHEDIKAFTCDLCGKKYGTRDVLTAHKKRVHNVYTSNHSVGRLPSYLANGNADL